MPPPLPYLHENGTKEQRSNFRSKKEIERNTFFQGRLLGVNCFFTLEINCSRLAKLLFFWNWNVVVDVDVVVIGVLHLGFLSLAAAFLAIGFAPLLGNLTIKKKQCLWAPRRTETFSRKNVISPQKHPIKFVNKTKKINASI